MPPGMERGGEGVQASGLAMGAPVLTWGTEGALCGPVTLGGN